MCFNFFLIILAIFYYIHLGSPIYSVTLFIQEVLHYIYVCVFYLYRLYDMNLWNFELSYIV